MAVDAEERAHGDVLHTGVVTECVKNSYEVVQAGPVIWVTVQSLLKGMSGQRNAHQSHCQLTNFVPHVHVSGIQHNSLSKERRRKYSLNINPSVIMFIKKMHLVVQSSAMPRMISNELAQFCCFTSK